MKKKSLILIVGIIGVITFSLVVIGLIFDKKEFEKQQGRTAIYDISPDGTIAYVFYNEGHPGIYLHNETANPREPLVELNIDRDIVDLSFSADGKMLAYSSSYKNKREELKSTIHVVYMDTNTEHELLAENTLITEVEYHPTNPDFIYYLKAGTFENYSPIASARPHDFDLFSYQFSNGETKQYTNLKKYMMESLRISAHENIAYVTMDDDEHVQTAEDVFETHQRIFSIDLNEPNAIVVASDESSDRDIYDFAVSPDALMFIYQTVANTGESGIFQYELFLYNRNTKTEEQLTFLEEYTSNPKFGPEGKALYYMVDTQFGKKVPDYRLYKMNIEGSKEEVVPLYMK